VTRRLDKQFTQILEKVAQTIAKSRNAKISSSKLNLKVQNIFIKPPSKLLKYLQQTTFSPQKFWVFKKVAQNGEILPNLVTQIGVMQQATSICMPY
jgi:hypothetical protein